MKRLPAAAVGVCLLLAIAGRVLSQESLEDTGPGRTLMGPAWNNDKLKDRVVMIVFWAAKDPRSFPFVAKAAKMDTELGPFGLVVIGASMQKIEDEQVEAKARSLGVRYSVTDNYGFKVATSISVPSTLVFGADGKKQFNGPSDKAEMRVRTALGAAIVDRATTKTFGKGVQPSVDNLRKGVPPTTVLSTLSSRKSDPDAKVLVDAICLPAKELLDEAKERLESDPVGVYNDAQRLSTVFKGTPVGTQAGDLFAKLKNDKSVQAELKAQPSLEKAQKIDEALEKIIKMDPLKNDPGSPEFQKAHQAQISQIRTIATQMRASWPKAKATSEASDIAMKYGVMFK
jgi:hypothetical protein